MTWSSRDEAGDGDEEGVAVEERRPKREEGRYYTAPADLDAPYWSC